MANVIVAGMQWGDEGKGKIVDLLCPAFDVVVRFQGGHNAGHTVKFGDRHFSLRLIPSGLLHPEMTGVLGNGMVIAPDALLEEIGELHDAGVDTVGRLFISQRATAILPWHVALDRAREAARGEAAIGTTSRGIGPAYESKASRMSVRIGDLGQPGLEKRLDRLAGTLGAQLGALGAAGESAAGDLDVGAMTAQCRDWAEKLSPYVEDTVHRLHRVVEEGRSVLFEGAQGALLDIDHGTFPYVTSSNTTAGAAATGSGVAPTALDGVVGLLKAYTTRVGGGPFPTELEDETGEFLRSRGNEFGTVTGRPRRCGWLDTVVARYSRRINGVSAIAFTKLDVLDDLDEIRIATAYRIRGETVRELPGHRADWAKADPVYKTVPGWKTDTVGILDFADLPRAAKEYLRLVEEEVGAPVGLVSTGPRREETVVCDLPVVRRLLGDRFDAVVSGRAEV
jgi:adenylosuccinate synthase